MFLGMPVPSGFHLSHRVGHGASFYIQICPLRSNKLLDKLESIHDWLGAPPRVHIVFNTILFQYFGYLI